MKILQAIDNQVNVNIKNNNPFYMNISYGTIDNNTFFSREVSSSFLKDLLSLSISTFKNFSEKNHFYMMRLMYVNRNEKQITLNSIGANALNYGDSTKVTNLKLSPSYVEGMNYVDDYQAYITSNNLSGIDTPREKLQNNNHYDYNNHNQIYVSNENLYPDDNNTGTFTEKWNLDGNLNSILNKTKRLFNQRKINTIISRFHTENGNYGSGDNITDYGMSHGRNLLKKGAEDGSQQYVTNGYNNPYCRVWTHHYQYDRLNKLIRPFVNVDEDGENAQALKLSNFHNWGKEFKLNEDDKGNGTSIGWKTSDNIGWDKSVIGDNGIVNITPKYRGGGKNNIHTKQCMFSIENLAWKGYDPYSFEKALSWEQRGPMGGRIMWFPPYGITFTEIASPQWNENTFIGRGEDVYTYTKTSRQGTLEFMLVVDHPSITDYASWYEGAEENIKDTDMLRFFAGCDSGQADDKDSLVSKVKPTPLTDEYFNENQLISPLYANEKKEEPIIEENIDEDTIKVDFYTFFPNNYSGYYDRTGKEVEAIPYLLSGNGSQKKYSKKNDENPIDDGINFNNLGTSRGYEMLDNKGISDVTKQNEDGNFIIGTTPNWNLKNTSENIYVNDLNKIWYYRIDGEYKIPPKNEWHINTYDQKLIYNKNYSDTTSFKLNCDINSVKKAFTDEKDNDDLYSLAEIAAILCKNKDSFEQIVKNSGIDTESDRFKNLKELFDKNTEKVTIKSIGYSNAHGFNESKEINDKRNNALAKNRALTIIDFIKNNCNFEINHNIDSTPSKYSDDGNVNSMESKKWRSAKTTIYFKKSNIKNVSETEQSYIKDDTKIVKETEYVGFTKVSKVGNLDLYRNDLLNINNNKLWYIDKRDKTFKVYNPDTFKRHEDSLHEFKSKKELNKVRYDQEYHFFKELENKDKSTFDRLMKKIKYFDPAFHSMTPEGFNARLTFLHQCTRQGNTVGASDLNSKSINNLAFGQAPYCVLRLGDFYNQMIIINNISISYDPLVWDLNTEGIGVQPLLAHVNISFTFIGGGDMGGAIRRLQNAMSFNYYSNTSLYDNRADKVEYNFDDKTCGAIDHSIKRMDIYNTKMND